MNKEESTVDEFSEDSVEDNSESNESSVPLSQFEKIKDDYLRLAADFDNYKKRTEKEKESIGAASIAYFVMAMTQENISKEVETFHNLMASVLESLQVTGIGEIGEDFDPSVHEAVDHTGEGESQKIEAVMRKGYLFQGNLIRPAMVKVKSE
jgi:molecular chaperone GrpE